MKKISWGTGIVISFIIFAVAALIMLWISMNSKVELVTDNYYEKELQYQTHINSVKNSQELPEPVILKSYNDTIQIAFPRIADKSLYKGEINFFRASNQANDFSIPVSLDSTFTQKITVSDKTRGLWRIKIFWSVEKNNYYFEQQVILQ